MAAAFVKKIYRDLAYSQQSLLCSKKGWRMVKSETHRDAETLVRNPSRRLFGKKFRDSKKVKTNHAKTRLPDLSKMLPRFRDPVKIFPRPTFFEVPFTTPVRGWVERNKKKEYWGQCEGH